MTRATSLILTSADHESIRHHLFSSESETEEAVFLFADAQRQSDSLQLRCREWTGIPPDGFVHRSPWFLELADNTRAQLIKKAHDLESMLIELHSHPLQNNACFSWSDLRGFDEFVPHVLWRLPNRPYAALVMTAHSFDGLVWIEPHSPQQITSITLEDCKYSATALTLANWNEINERPPI